MFGKCLAGNANFNALITYFLQKVQILTNEFSDQKYYANILLFQSTFFYSEFGY